MHWLDCLVLVCGGNVLRALQGFLGLDGHLFKSKHISVPSLLEFLAAIQAGISCRYLAPNFDERPVKKGPTIFAGPSRFAHPAGGSWLTSRRRRPQRRRGCRSKFRPSP